VNPAEPSPDVRRQCELALASTAHDLREPLRALAAWIGLLRDHLAARLDPRGAQYLEQALACAARGREVVDDLLDLASAEARAAPLEDVPLELALAEALGDLSALLEECHARVDVARLPLVRARRRDVVRVLQNVVANALHARRGPGPVVRVRADCVRDADGHERVELRVEDDGVGLDGAEAEGVFEPFRRLRPERPGSGLGLTLCRRLVASHGGDIALRPREGGGAVCVVRWDAARAPASSLSV